MTYRQDLWDIAADHHGIVTTRQANDVGVPSVELRKLAARGALERVGHGVYRHCGVRVDARTEAAAVLAEVGAEAFLEGESVLAMFDLALVSPVALHVGTRRRRRGRALAHTVITVRPCLADGDLTTYDGLRCVTVRRALSTRSRTSSETAPATPFMRPRGAIFSITEKCPRSSVRSRDVIGTSLRLLPSLTYAVGVIGAPETPSREEMGGLGGVAEYPDPPGQLAAVARALGFGPPAPVPLISGDLQIVQKIHAVTAPGSQRAHDLIDLQSSGTPGRRLVPRR